MPWPPLTRPRQFVNPVTLSALAGMSFVYGLAYLVGDIVNYDGESLQLVRIYDDVLPGVIYGSVWLLIASCCLAGLFSRRVFKVAYSALAALAGTWSGLYLVLWIVDPSSYGLLVSATWWFAMAAAVYTLTVTELTAVKSIADMRGCDENEVS